MIRKVTNSREFPFSDLFGKERGLERQLHDFLRSVQVSGHQAGQQSITSMQDLKCCRLPGSSRPRSAWSEECIRSVAQAVFIVLKSH